MTFILAPVGFRRTTRMGFKYQNGRFRFKKFKFRKIQTKGPKIN